MKRFKFRLQKLLEIRQAKEDELMAELAQLRREEAEEAARLSRLVSEVSAARTLLEEALTVGKCADEVTRRDEYAKAKCDDVRVQELTIEAVQTRVEAKLSEVVDAMKERKVLESLRDRQELAHIAADAAMEQSQLDEIASLRFARGM